MEILATLAGLAAALAVLAVSVVRERRERRVWRVGLVPAWLVQFLALTMALLMAAHLITLLTGRPFVGRYG